jgi:benzoate-CoA ligase family protein
MTELFNASDYLVDRQLSAGNGSRLAVTGAGGDASYADLHSHVERAATVLRELGLQPEQRVLMFMSDSPAFVIVFLAAMRIGAVPVPVSTMLLAAGLSDLLRDSRARILAVTGEFAGTARAAAAEAPELVCVLAAGPPAAGGDPGERGSVPWHDMERLVTAAEPYPGCYPTTEDSPAFWLYTSGTTGKPKAAMHRHDSIRVVSETYGTQVLGIRPDDRCLSAAKAFFAYGLGNSVLFPLSTGATAILEPAPSRPAPIAACARNYRATLFFAGPTFFANMLHGDLAADALAGVRLAASAGEPLPAALYQRWTSRFGVDVLDGIGMTEMLHIFLSNREGQVRPGTTGVAVPGYDLRIVDDESGRDLPAGAPGTLFVRGASSATGYWSRYDASRQVFQGEWLRTGDTYVRDADGYFTCLGRTDDMLKASGIWISPAEIEARLMAHPAVERAIVVGAPDPDGLHKPVAYLVLRSGCPVVTEPELIDFCRQGLPSYARPRRVVFVEEYPTTATGKIRRVELRAMAAVVLAEPEHAPDPAVP